MSEAFYSTSECVWGLTGRKHKRTKEMRGIFSILLQGGGYRIYRISLTCIYLRSVHFPVGKFYLKKTNVKDNYLIAKHLSKAAPRGSSTSYHNKTKIPTGKKLALFSFSLYFQLLRTN